ncbi:hypothetical protein KIN20_024171 [Parelaphostrongylus tenuis]|uniref:Uncharacterized protein n=1 Tax=Parelaphostrongylus tenuis TaxID=148309 RepID=A0AAD5QVS8_PARTN|nr:hypothetical protein KIN20_024171 [Parelaphostrongylus tenuis]
MYWTPSKKYGRFFVDILLTKTWERLTNALTKTMTPSSASGEVTAAPVRHRETVFEIWTIE